MVNGVTVNSLYKNTKAILKLAKIENYRNEAQLLVSKATGIARHQLLILGDKYVTDDSINEIEKLIDRRKCGEPLQYILGEWEFYGLDFKVGEGVLIPRQDTETLVSVALERAKKYNSPRIADLCSGSGCVAISLEKNIEGASVTAVELSDKAIPYLLKNIALNDSSVKFIKGDVCDVITMDNLTQLEMIVSNPPYLTESDMKCLQKEVEYEPSMALSAGEDGLDFYRAISALWKDKLVKGGTLAFECGINQHEDIKNILEENGYIDVCFTSDLCGIIRVVSAVKE